MRSVNIRVCFCFIQKQLLKKKRLYFFNLNDNKFIERGTIVFVKKKE
jgi:hypothetical protein